MRRLVSVKAIILIAACIVVIGTGAFVVWASNPLGPMPEALVALQSDDQVTVTLDPWMTFAPADSAVDSGLILYPGGRVDARSYAPIARAIAEEGFMVVVPTMPLNLAVFDPGAAADIIAANEGVNHWFVGGHSLGGAMAGNYVYKNPDDVDGLVLWASYPADSNSFADRDDLRVLSIYGSEDGHVEDLAAAADLLPADTMWQVIDGGNHAQFGSYGKQPGDGKASISREEQQAQIVEATLTLLETYSVIE